MRRTPHNLDLEARHFAYADTPFFRKNAGARRGDARGRRPVVEHYWTGEPIELPIRPSSSWVNGYVIYKGPSEFDGKPIVVIATGFVDPSDNRKTGPMIQTWILREDLDPREAVWSGEDVSICGECIHRGEVISRLRRPRSGGRRRRVRASVGRSCYVVVAQAPLGVYRSYKKGLYPEVELEDLAHLFDGAFPVRLGSYGDPVAVPVEVWKEVLRHQVVWTGYTHQWDRKGAYRYKKFLMASVDSPSERKKAEKKGWRTFRIGRRNEPLIAGVEIICPGMPEGGLKTTCDSCNLCMGATKVGARSVVVPPHGSGARFHEERGRQNVPVRSNPLLAIVGNPPVRSNPLLAIVGNPPTEVFDVTTGRGRIYGLPPGRAVERAALEDGEPERAESIPGWVRAGRWYARTGSRANPSRGSHSGDQFYWHLLETVDHALRKFPQQQLRRGGASITERQWVLLWPKIKRTKGKVSRQTAGRAWERFKKKVRNLGLDKRDRYHARFPAREGWLHIDIIPAFDLVWKRIGGHHPAGMARELELLRGEAAGAREELAEARRSRKKGVRARRKVAQERLDRAERELADAERWYSEGILEPDVGGDEPYRGVPAGAPTEELYEWLKEEVRESGRLAPEPREGVVARGLSGRFGGRRSTQGKRTNPQTQTKKRPRTERISLDEAKQLKGFDEATKAYRKFHGTNPEEVTLFFLPDGSKGKRYDNVHAALHRTLETPYMVPWKSNKKGSLWLHEHPEGEGAPLEVLDPFTGTTRKIAGDYVVSDWWYS